MSSVDTLGPEIAAIAASGRADAADDALALLADAYFLQSAGLWTFGLALLHYRAGFGISDERPIPEELWGEEVTIAIRQGTPVRLERAPDGWRQAERPHLVLPVLGSDSSTRGVVIASADAAEIPADLPLHVQALSRLLDFTEGSPKRIADDLERDIGSSLWAALLGVQDAPDAASRRAAAALRAALADLRATVVTLRHGLPRVQRLADAAIRYGDAYGLAVDHDGFPGEDALPAADRAALIAVIREALENAALHGRARRVHIQAGRSDEGMLVMIVDDDGQGVADDVLERARARGALGLAAIEGHAQARGGTLRVGRSELGGMRVEVAIPAV